MIIFPASTVTYSNVFQLYANLTYVVSVSNRAYVPSRKYVTHPYLFGKRIQRDSTQIYTVLQLNLVKLSLQKRITIYQNYK